MKKELSAYDFNCVEKTNYFASMIYPHTTKSNARRVLSHFIEKHTELQEQLRKQGWEKNEIFIYRPQMRLILRALNGTTNQEI